MDMDAPFLHVGCVPWSISAWKGSRCPPLSMTFRRYGLKFDSLSWPDGMESLRCGARPVEGSRHGTCDPRGEGGSTTPCRPVERDRQPC